MNFKEEVSKYNINLNDSMLNKLEGYFSFLVDYNTHTNLTAITEKSEVYIKHFLDSMLLLSSFNVKGKTLCDVGAGAGFPSVPCAIVEDTLSVDIVDSLNKRINFLNELVSKIELSNVKAYHSRAEDWALTKRESYDIVSARAVARLNILAELCMPLVKIGGVFIAMKSKDYEEELKEARSAIKTLGGEILEVKHFDLPYEYGERNIIIIKKVKECPKKYPRAFAKIKQNPIK